MADIHRIQIFYEIDGKPEHFEVSGTVLADVQRAARAARDSIAADHGDRFHHCGTVFGAAPILSVA